jgi:hypothetical protein
VKAEVIDLVSLKGPASCRAKPSRPRSCCRARSRAVKVRGIKVTKGARKAIEAAGGSIEEV